MASKQSTQDPRPTAWDPRPLADLTESLAETPNVIADIIATFLAHSTKTLDRMRAAAAAGNISDLAIDSHSLKGSAGTLGALHLTDLCAELEAASRGPRRNSLNLEVAILAIDRELDTVQVYLAARLSELRTE